MSWTSEKRRVIIMGAAGRDFHNFNMVYRDNPGYQVVAFTATQIPGIEGRRYPKELAGKLYPDGVPIFPEERLTELIRKYKVDEVVFAYSDVPHSYVMNKASEALAAGADFRILSPESTMLKSSKPVIAICAVRTGAGKSPASRKVEKILKNAGVRVVAVRHPMPYGDLVRQAVQRFATLDDLDKHNCTVEEREDYEPHIRNGFVVYSGVDYEKILREAEKEADVIIWDGGNNDYSFFKADLYITIADAYRPGHEVGYHPGETNFRMADVIVISKIDGSNKDGVRVIEENIKRLNPRAKIVKAGMRDMLDDPDAVRGKRVLVIEDGPTVTHGGMAFGAAYMVAKENGVREMVDPKPYAVGMIKETFEKYKHLRNILPAVGYSRQQIRDLEETINRTECDAVISGTPTDLGRILKVNKPLYQVKYELEEIGKPDLEEIVKSFLKSRRLT